MRFDGEVLRRGFWLYIWDIRFQNQRFTYVGGTGDISSVNASSPFARIGRHLNPNKNAKGNSIATRLKDNNIDQCECSFDMVAIDPIFPEVEDKDKDKDKAEHKRLALIVGRLEGELARILKARANRTYVVLGKHPVPTGYDPVLLQQVLTIVDPKSP